MRILANEGFPEDAVMAALEAETASAAQTLPRSRWISASTISSISSLK